MRDLNREKQRSIQKGVKNIIQDLQIANHKAKVEEQKEMSFSQFKKPRARKNTKKERLPAL